MIGASIAATMPPRLPDCQKNKYSARSNASIASPPAKAPSIRIPARRNAKTASHGNPIEIQNNRAME